MKIRLLIFITINILVVLVWISYLFCIQILDIHNFRETIELRQNPSKNIIIPDRGNIYDTNGKLLVSSIKYYQIDIDRNLISKYCKNENENEKNKYLRISEIISKYSNLSEKKILKKLNRKPLNSCIFLSDNISEAELLKISDAFHQEKIPGLVKTFSKMKRTYPYGKLGANFLGAVKEMEEGNTNSRESIYKVVGSCGLEVTFDNELSGEIGWQETIYDANNKRIPLVFLKEKTAKCGNSLYLTIDNDLQEILEENLNNGLKEYKAKKALGIIMEPATGAILAMSGLSSKHRSAAEIRSSANIPVSFMFEPGSTLKPITALLAIEKNIYKPSDKIDCRNYHITYKSEDRTIKDDHKYNFLSFKDIIAHSSNVGISKIVEEIGSKALYERMIAFGFGHKTSSNIAGESSGILRKLKDWQGFSLHSISFGQEISTTTLQLANAYCTIANGGKVMQPYIVKEIKDENNKIIKTFKPKKLRTISDKRSLNTLKQFLKAVVDYGTAIGTKSDFLEIAGKTGTAEKTIYGLEGYAKEKYTSIFAGFFPVDEPEYVIVIVYDEPDYSSYSYYASNSAVPTFRKITTNIINLPQSKTICDIKEREKDFIFAPNVIGMTKEKAIDVLKKKDILFTLKELNPNSLVVDQFPKPNTSFDKSKSIIVILDKEEQEQPLRKFDYEMPKLIGLTLRKAVNMASKKNIKLIAKGNGIIISQSIPPGTKTKYGEKCIVKAN